MCAGEEKTGKRANGETGKQANRKNNPPCPWKKHEVSFAFFRHPLAFAAGGSPQHPVIGCKPRPSAE